MKTRSAQQSKNTAGLLQRYRSLISANGQSDFTKSIVYFAACGIVTGLSLLILLPASSALVSGSACLTMSFAQWMLCLAVLSALGVVLEFMSSATAYGSALDMIRNLLHRIGDKLARLPLGWFQQSSAGNLSRVASQDLMALGNSLAHLLGKLIRNLCTVVIVAIGVLIWNWRLGLIVVISIPIMWILLKLSQYFITKGKRISDPAEQEISDRIVEFARCQGALRACNRSTSFTALEQANVESTRAQQRSLGWQVLANLIGGVGAQMIVVAMMYCAAVATVDGVLNPITAVAFIGLSLRFVETLEGVTAGLLGIEDNRVMLDHVDDIFNAPVLPEPNQPAALTDPGAIDVQHVSFSYDTSKSVLNDVSFTVRPGQMVALIGPSGGGKSTVEKLIARFYDVQSGDITVGGVSVRKQPTAELMHQLSIVFQDVYLFDDTLKANIQIGNPEATMEEIAQAGELAGVTDIVKRIPDGWNARVGEGGHALSGGERQRVSIARSLLKKAPIVLFDEATSALDAENEQHIVDCVERLRENSTILVIAHKLNTIRSADMIIVLDASGHIVQRGTHESLIRQHGQYANFYKAREQASQWKL